MESGDQAVLQLRLEVDHQVAAAEQVEAREGRVLDDVLDGEHDHLADLLLHAIAGVLLGEEAAQALRRDIQRDVRRIEPGTCDGDGVVVEVGRVELDPDLAVGVVHVLAQQDRDRVGLLAGRAARDPGPEHVVGGLVGKQLRQDVPLQHLERLAVAEEARHVDEHFLEQGLQLGGLFLQVAQVDRQVVDVVLQHAALDAATDRALLVEREVVARHGAQQHQDLVDPAGRRAWRRGVRAAAGARDMPERVRHPVDGQDVGREARPDGAGRHAVEPRRGRILDDRDAARADDRPHAQRAVGAGARQDDPDGVLALVLGERAQEGVDRHALPARLFELGELQHAVEDAHAAVRRDHEDGVRAHGHLVGRLGHRERRHALQDLRQETRVARVEMRHEHERHACVGRHVAEEFLEGFESAGGRADADDRKAGAVVVLGLCRRSFRDHCYVFASVREGGQEAITTPRDRRDPRCVAGTVRDVQSHMSSGPAGGAPGACGTRATMQSVVRIRPAIDAAFCSAVRVTLQGSSTPIFTRSPYSPVPAL